MAAVANGAAAVRAVQQESFDMVLMDVQMPEMNGLEATARHSRLGTTAAADTCPSWP